MKKQISIVSCSALVLAIVASCSSNAPVMNNTGKVDSVSVSQINKVQANENGTVKVNLKLTTSQPKFGIKTVTQGWVSTGNIDKIVLKLHSNTISSGNPQARFDNTTVVPMKTFTYPIAPAGGFLAFTSGVFNATVTPISFNNLKANETYRVSARAYSPNFNNNAGSGSITGTSATNTITATGTSWATPGSRNQLFIGDMIKINTTDVYTVTAIGGNGSITVAPSLSTSYTSATYTVETNVTAEVGGSTNLGGSMGSNGLQLGGGTAGGLATGAGDEEVITVTPAGLPQITNDGFFGSTPARVGGTTGSLDVAIQLMKDYGGQADGNVRVYQGGYDPETITP